MANLGKFTKNKNLTQAKAADIYVVSQYHFPDWIGGKSE
jgi:hypothetical protein